MLAVLLAPTKNAIDGERVGGEGPMIYLVKPLVSLSLFPSIEDFSLSRKEIIGEISLRSGSLILLLVDEEFVSEKRTWTNDWGTITTGNAGMGICINVQQVTTMTGKYLVPFKGLERRTRATRITLGEGEGDCQEQERDCNLEKSVLRVSWRTIVARRREKKR